MNTNVIDCCGRLAEVRRRRETALRAEFAAVASNIPESVLVAIFKALRDKRPDAIMQLPSSWRKRTLAAWRAVVLEQSQPTASIVSFPFEG
jgi:hypothetical protein